MKPAEVLRELDIRPGSADGVLLQLAAEVLRLSQRVAQLEQRLEAIEASAPRFGERVRGFLGLAG